MMRIIRGMCRNNLKRSNASHRVLKSERGIALVMVLVISLIALAIVSTMLYFVLQGTRFSGFFKRYETAREAGMGGAELGGALISGRGKLEIPGYASFVKQCDCGDPDIASDNKVVNSDGTLSAPTGTYVCLCAKLCDATANWPSSCNSSLDAVSSPDMQLSLSGLGPTTFDASVKIVDTIPGYTDLSGEELGGTGVVASSSMTLRAPPQPYLYRMEINAQDSANVIERSRLSVLYAY